MTSSPEWLEARLGRRRNAGQRDVDAAVGSFQKFAACDRHVRSMAHLIEVSGLPGTDQALIDAAALVQQATDVIQAAIENGIQNLRAARDGKATS